MATPYPGLKKVGEVWHYHLKVNGQRAHGSTRARDLPTAKRVLEARRQELLHAQLKLPRQIPTLRELYEDWVKAHAAVFSAKHLVTVSCVFRRWIQPVLGPKRIDQLGNQDALHLRASLLNAKRSGRYANNALQYLRLLLNFGIKLGLLRELPFNVRPLRLQKKPRPIVPAVRIKEFLEAADRVSKSPQMGIMLWTLVGLGLREGELLGMRWEWFDLERRTYIVGKAKGKEARVLPVPDWLWNKLMTATSRISEWVFPAEDGKPHRSQFCKKALKRICSELGLGNVTQHRLRATFASLHAQAGTPITEIQGMLGHKSITTTMIYVEQTIEAKRKAQDSLSQQLGLA